MTRHSDVPAMIFYKKNISAMNRCIDTVMKEVQKQYTVTTLDPGEFKNLKLFGFLKFHIEQYGIEELGNLSFMRVNMGAYRWIN